MEFFLRSLLFTVAFLNFCFAKTVITKWGEPVNPLPEGVTIFAVAIEEEHGGYNIIWDVQPPDSIRSVQPKIKTMNNIRRRDYDGEVHTEANSSECLSRLHPNDEQYAVIVIKFRNCKLPYTHFVRTLSPSPISKSK